MSKVIPNMLRPGFPSDPPNLLRLAALLMDVIHAGRLPDASRGEAMRLLQLACELAPLAQTNADEARRRTGEVGAVWEGIRELLLAALDVEQPPLRMLHAPPPLFGIWPVDPIVVEVIAIDHDRGMATVKAPVAPNAVINVIRGPGDPIVTSAQREVIFADLKPLSGADAEPADGSPSSASSSTTTTGNPRRLRR